MHASFALSRRILFPLLIIVLFIAGCSDDKMEVGQTSSAPEKPLFSQEPSSTFHSISVAEAKEMIEKRPDIVILDIRTPQELREGALENSTLVPFWAIMQNKLTLPKETPIMLVCAVGGRSFAAGQMLVKYGYQEVYNVSGGLVAWKEAGLPVKY
ncbi:MAG: rhodanese-like domain-containing protein [Proteobacteria bacterium]|nr:rhodanese-like domain-containing protein [Pseudomonadota bacterium]MBU4296097.1 rhodanese-like domain-containing protein [Pseudomonadota bacterium]MCG2746981.1 rhodanese-like domain-containing protein [Desulfobulbaceae bacterium]